VFVAPAKAYPSSDEYSKRSLLSKPLPPIE
jgi:hypothetical protein